MISYNLFFFGFIVLLFTTETYALDSKPEPSRQVFLANLLKQDCGSCHGLKLKGGLGTPLRPEKLKGKTDEYLTSIISFGIPGTPMPGWNMLLTKKDIKWIVKLLKEGAIKGD